MEDSPIYTTPPRHKWATEDAQADNRMLRAAVGSLIARVEKAEAQVKEHPADLAGLIRQIQLRDKEAAEAKEHGLPLDGIAHMLGLNVFQYKPGDVVRAVAKLIDRADETDQIYGEALGEWKVNAGAAHRLLLERNEAHQELTYERQMRQQAEEARDKLVRRVKEQQDELAEQERDKLRLIQETYNWSAAVKKLEAERVAQPPKSQAKAARAKAKAILTGANPSAVQSALIQPQR